MKECFSYIRFSSKKQEKGSSEDRQHETAQRVALQNGWTFRTDLNAQDLGVSASKGHNLNTIKAIIEAAKAGRIPQGTVCIVEKLDRFSRLGLKGDADRWVVDFVRSGVELYNAKTGRHLTKENIDNFVERMLFQNELEQAAQYTDDLAMRVKAAHKIRGDKILKGEIIYKTKEGHARKDYPSWISVTDNGFELNGISQIIGSMFTWYLSGKGPGKIAQELNMTDVKTFTGKGVWSQSQIYKLLSNRQLIGEYTVNGETVKNYLPSVVSEEIFLKVQARLNENKGKRPTGNEEGRITNIFSGVAYCSCGQRIKVCHSKGGYDYMTCYGVIKGLGCKTGMVKYDGLETSFARLLTLKADELVQDETGNTVNNTVQILKGRLAETEKQIANITEALSIAVTKSLVLKQSALESEAEGIRKDIELESAKKVTLKGGQDRLNGIIQRLNDLKSDKELRTTIQVWIRENVNRIDVNRSEKTYNVEFKNGQYITMNFDGSVIACKSFFELFGQNTVNLTETYQQQTYGA
jgi:DNA invertase Pin-like site-specific DNA recombinase